MKFRFQDSTNVDEAFARMAKELKTLYEGGSSLENFDDGRVMPETKTSNRGWGCCSQLQQMLWCYRH